ncbi:type II toxin-antitoxin system RelB/DinJ family antitoxin, partial [Pantoea vagans]|uniref:type II toxin-antitoxin system RelB/DinJ family antitoxin n=1 Tax=Pantoea vagans TaxID=470934 RepID=UPI0028A27B08
ARVDEQIKNEAAAVLADMGLTVSDLMRIALTKVAKEKAVPFDMKVPNATTLKAMRDLDAGRGETFETAEDLFKDLGI